MKYVAALLFLGMSTVAVAQTSAVAPSTPDQTLKAITALDAGAAKLAAAQVDIAEDAHIWAAGRNVLTKNMKDTQNDLDVQRLDSQKQNEYANSVNAMTASYNARCSRTFNRETEMDQYNQCASEHSQLEPMVAKVTDWEQSVNRLAAAVNAKVAKNAADATSINAMQASLKGRIAANEAAGQQYLAQRRVLALQYQAQKQGQSRCAGALKSAADEETIKEACGMLFDGSKMHDAVLVQVPGVPVPVWKPWNDNDPRWHIDD